MKRQFNQAPKCEVCGKRIAKWFVTKEDVSGQLIGWHFVCEKCSQGSPYFFEIRDFFKSLASTVDWMAHLSEKGMDMNLFCEMMERFRKATGSFNQ